MSEYVETADVQNDDDNADKDPAVQLREQADWYEANGDYGSRSQALREAADLIYGGNETEDGDEGEAADEQHEPETDQEQPWTGSIG